MDTTFLLMIFIFVMFFTFIALWRARATGYIGGKQSRKHSKQQLASPRKPRRLGAQSVAVKDLSRNPRSLTEQRVIRILENATGKKFPSVYPSWLLYNGRPMELDGYCEELNLAVEVNGPLHYKHYPEIESYQKYKLRVDKDIEKTRLCELRGVKYFVVPTTIPTEHFSTYIHSRLYDLDIIKDRPINYLTPQPYEPYLSPQMEKLAN